jgi:hypothetical protein
MTARKADYLKLLSNTARADRAAPETGPTLPRVDTVPLPPTWLPNAFAMAEWQRMAPQLVALKLLTEGNLGIFSMFCSLHGHLLQSWTTGEPPTAALINVYRRLGTDLGLTNIATPVLKPERKNRFEELAKSSRGRR